VPAPARALTSQHAHASPAWRACHSQRPGLRRRYAAGDAVEAWLNGLLCLDAAEHVPRPPARLPHPGECELYHIERDTLFSYHKVRGCLPRRGRRARRGRRLTVACAPGCGSPQS
jgi:hypothetical protein